LKHQPGQRNEVALVAQQRDGPANPEAAKPGLAQRMRKRRRGRGGSGRGGHECKCKFTFTFCQAAAENATSGLKNGVPAFPDRLAWGLDTRTSPTAQDRSACLRLFETTSRRPVSLRPLQ